MDTRQQKILEAIMNAFIKSGSPIGSMMIYESHRFDVSPATIRNEMAVLEEEGFIMQPHTSAGRVPTARAYRMLVDEMELTDRLMLRARRDIEQMSKDYYIKQAKEKLYDIVAILASVTQNISFATLPDSDQLFYLGVSNILRQPEFASDPARATQVIEVIENELHGILAELTITPQGAVYIGDENILPEFQSCSLMAVPYQYKGFHGVLGILGPTRMDYPYNMAALKSAAQLL